MNFSSLFLCQKPDRQGGLPGLRGGVINELPFLTVGLLTPHSLTRDHRALHVLFRGINATIEVYIQHTDSLIKVLNFYQG
jgi:hypothetical protein